MSKSDMIKKYDDSRLRSRFLTLAPTNFALMEYSMHVRNYYPSWEDLCQSFAHPRQNPEFLKAVTKIKSNPPDLRYRIARFIVTTMLKDEVYQKFLTCTWSEIVDLLADHAARNREISPIEENVSGSAPLAMRTNSRFSRPYGQMPCTRSTARRRVKKALSLVSKDSPVLLLGDDDLVSVELALAGFKSITVLDIDLKVLEEIQRQCDENNVRVKLFQHDLSLPAPDHLKTDYSLVFFDPEYSIRGVNLFLNAALELTQNAVNTVYFMSIHLMSLMRQGLVELEDIFQKNHLELSEFAQGFNAYPAPSRLKSLIHIVNQILIGSRTLSTEGYSFPFLLSDALILRKSS